MQRDKTSLVPRSPTAGAVMWVFSVLFFGLALFAQPVIAQPAAWGGVRGQVVYAGEAPAPVMLNVNLPPQCVQCALVDEELQVDPPTGGIANVVIYLRSAVKEIHPKLQKLKGTNVAMDIRCCRFEPRIAPLWIQQGFVITNTDPVNHNASCAPPGAMPFNPLIAAGRPNVEIFAKAQRLPQPIHCSIHHWMKGFVLPLDTPYFAVTGTDGTFEINDLPAGDHEFQFWQEKAGYLDAAPGSKRGRATLSILAGETLDLGQMRIEPKIFEK